jgi:rare lipoprotein A
MIQVLKMLRVVSVAAVTLCMFSPIAKAAPETGLAAVYSTRLAGHRTASGKRYRPSALTMAHRTLAFGTKVKITNKKNGKSVLVTVTDRGPRQAGRVADISSAAARVLGIGAHRMSEVEIEPQP